MIANREKGRLYAGGPSFARCSSVRSIVPPTSPDAAYHAHYVYEIDCRKLGRASGRLCGKAEGFYTVKHVPD